MVYMYPHDVATLVLSEDICVNKAIAQHTRSPWLMPHTIV